MSEKRRFIRREAATEPADDDGVQLSGNISSRSAAAADAGVNQSIAAEKSSVINGHTSVECQPSEH